MSLIGYQAEFGPWCTGTLPVAESLKRNIRNAAPKGRKWQPLMGYIGGKARRTAGRTVTGQVRAGTGGNGSGDGENGEDFEAESLESELTS